MVDWNPEANALFVRALKIPSPEERAAFLAEACAGDPALRAEVEQLLKAHAEAGDFLQRPLLSEVGAQLQAVIPEMRAMGGLGPADTPLDSHLGGPETAGVVSGVLGDFEIVREIGRGGMGVVYEVIDRKQGIELALKVLRDPTAAAVLRLKREFRSLASVGHRNLVVLDRLFCSDHRWFFTMELIRGGSFTEYVGNPVGPDAATERLPPETGSAIAAAERRRPGSCRGDVHYARLRRALEQAALGLGALHQAGMLHRDVKPSNVLVSEEGRVVLVDFGLVAELKEACPSEVGGRTWGGTQPYMSPEQMASEPLTYASDWYSVGVMLYQALSGHLPFEGDFAEVLSQKRAGPPPGLLDAVPPDQRDLRALCIDLLQPDPARRPTGSEILRRIRRRDNEDEAAPLEDAQDERPVFVGRQRQLAGLQQALDDVRAGLSLRVYVSGKPGMGKTALVEHFLSVAGAAAQAVVLRGRCYEREAMPYKALDSLVDALVRHLDALPAAEVGQLLPEDLPSLVRVFPALLHVPRLAAASRGTVPVDDRESRTRAIASFREILKRLAERALTILVVDDLQWGDLDSAAFLSELLAPPEPPRLLFVACYRSDDRAQSECLQALLPEGQGEERNTHQREMLIDELSREEAHELAVALFGTDRPLAEDLAAFSRQIGGSPYLISELARRARQEGRQTLAAGGGSADLAAMLARRIEQLPPAVRRLLTVIAVSGRPIRLDVACRVAGLGPEPGVALALLRSENLIRTLADADHKVAPYHDCIREAAAAQVPLSDRNRLHFEIANVLEQAADTDPAELCRHFESAGDYDKAGHYALVAAESAARALAFDQAAAMYRAAIEWRKATAEERWLLRRKLADALSHAGRIAEAAEEYAALATCADPAVRTDMERLAAMHYLISGHVDSGCVWLDRVLKNAGIPVPKSRWRMGLSILVNGARLRWRGLELGPPRQHRRQIDQARLQAYWCAIIGLGMVDLFRAGYYMAKNLLLSLQHGDPALAARALAMQAFNSGFCRGTKAHRRSQNLLGRAALLSEQAGDPYARALLQLARGMTAAGEGDWPAALAQCRDSERSFREDCRFVFWELSTAQMTQLAALTWLGRFNESARGVRQTFDEANQRGDLYTMAGLAGQVQMFLHLVADEPDQAESEINAVLARWSLLGPWQHVVGLLGRFHVAIYQGCADRALETLAQARARMGGSAQWRIQYWRLLFREGRARALIVAARTARDRRPLLKAAARLGRSLQREDHPYAAGYAPLLQAPLAFAEGRREQAVALLRSALAAFEQAGMALYAAAARRRLGAVLGGQAGSEMAAQAEAWMKSENVVNVERITDLFCPWIVED